MPDFLWCSKCEMANEESKWNTEKFKYGVCPSCGCSAYRSAVRWETIYEANGYAAIPNQGEVYSAFPSFDL